MSDDFSLDKSRWYQTMKVGLHGERVKNEAEFLARHSTVLANFSYDGVIGTELANAELALEEALLAVKVARETYERVTKLQAAE